MDKIDGGPANWSALLLILAVVGGITAAQVPQRAASAAQGKGSAVLPARNAPKSAEAASVLSLLGVSVPSEGTDLASATLRELMAKARASAVSRSMSVEFLIATLPDYVDSSSGWSFDATLDAVQRAAGAAGYVLDRFYLPDWIPGDDTSEHASATRHETEPGLVLFRRITPTGVTEILAVFVIAETPTAGVHEAAFLNAAEAIAAWYEASPPPDRTELRILGPTFSGASLSLRLAIQAFLARHPAWPQSVRVLSGSATNRGNQELLTFSSPSPDPSGVRHVRYAATVQTDDVMLGALYEHLVEINPRWKDGAGVVLLTESNTGYGRSFAARPAETGTDGKKTDDSASADPFSQALRIQFPIHISRLRAGPRSSDSSEAGTSDSNADGMMRDVSAATDHLPAMTPEITANTIDLVVSSILSTVRREEYPAIGIFATDKRDHLFLAERLVREMPNALLFTTEANLIYIHPQFRSFVRGAIVASTYPLFNATQALSSPHLAGVVRQQFSTMASQGTYNAVLKLLGHDDLLLDYLPPGCMVPGDKGQWRILTKPSTCAYPPVWISVVGRDGLWPIDRHTGTQANPVVEAVADVGPLSGASPSGSRGALLHVATWMKAAFVVLLLLLVIHTVAYLSEIHSTRYGRLPTWMRWSRPSTATGRFERLKSHARSLPCSRILHVDHDEIEQPFAREHRLFLLIAVTILWFTSVWAMRLFTVWLRDATPAVSAAIGSPGQSSMIPNVWYLLYFSMLAILVVESGISIQLRRAAVPRGWVAGAIVTVAGLFMAMQAGLNLARFIGSDAWNDVVSAKLLFARTANPGNWVSPAAPLLALSGVLYIWALWNIRQLVMGGSTYRRSSELSQLLTGREPRLTDEVGDVMVSPWRRQNWLCLAIPFVLLILFAVYVPRWYTPDGMSFNRFLWWGSMLTLFLIAHSLAMTMHLGLLVGRILRHLGAHPIAPAFRDVAKEPFNWQLSLTPPHAIELNPLARKARTLRLLLQRLAGAPGAVGHVDAVRRERSEPRQADIVASVSLADVAVAGRGGDVAAVVANMLSTSGQRVVVNAERNDDLDRDDSHNERRRASGRLPVPLVNEVESRETADAASIIASALEVRQQDVRALSETIGVDLADALDEEMREGSSRPYFKSHTWHTLVRLSDGLIPALRHGFWQRGSAAIEPALQRWYQDAEVLVGLQAAFVLRDLLARLVSGMTFAIIGAAIALASHLFYAFPGRSAMLALDWVLLALATIAAAVMLLRLDKDPVLNLLWSKAPGRLIWTGGFVYRLGAYGAVPVITLFVWQFPEVGGRLFSWLEPLQKAIP
jgi:hypothetical protein